MHRTATHPRRPTRMPAWSGDVFLVASLGVLYLNTLLPGVGFHRDTAKYAFLGKVLGTAHPPGYPLYTMINALFVRAVPIGTLAWRVNLLSAVLGVATCVVLYRALLRMNLRRLPAAVGVLMLGASFTFWQQAIVAEVYTLTTLFIAVVVYFLVRWMQEGHERHAYAALGIYAVSFANHMMMVLLAPGIVLLLALTGGRKLVSWRSAAVLALAGCAAVAQYAYIFWRTADPSVAYLEVPMRDLATFWDGITVKTFRGLMFAFGVRETITDRIPLLGSFAWRELSIMIVAAVYGLVRLWRTRRAPVAVMLAAWIAVVVIFGLGYAVNDVYVFLIPAWLAAWIAAAVGLDHLARRLRYEHASAVIAVLPLLLVAINYPAVDMSHDDYGRQLEFTLDAVPDRSIIFSSSGVAIQGLNYYLAADGTGTRREIFVYPGMTQQSPVGHVRRYCAGTLRHMLVVNRDVPADLNVFLLTSSYAAAARAEGLRPTPAGPQLYAVECPERVDPRLL